MTFITSFDSFSNCSLSLLNFSLVEKFPSVHSVLNNIRSWDTSIEFFLTFKFLKVFNLSIKNKLFNKLKKFISDKKLMLQLKKIIHSGFIDFSSELIYSNSFIGFHSSLSRFFFELLLVDFDKFLDIFNDQYFVSFSLKKSLKSFLSVSFYFYNPLKFNSILKKFSNLRSLLSFRNLEVQKASFFELTKNNVHLNKFLFKERFIDNSIIGIIGSKNLVSALYMKFEGFVRSQMLFDLMFSEILSSKEAFIFFAGFNIRLC